MEKSDQDDSDKDNSREFTEPEKHEDVEKGREKVNGEVKLEEHKERNKEAYHSYALDEEPTPMEATDEAILDYCLNENYNSRWRIDSIDRNVSVLRIYSKKLGKLTGRRYDMKLLKLWGRKTKYIKIIYKASKSDIESLPEVPPEKLKMKGRIWYGGRVKLSGKRIKRNPIQYIHYFSKLAMFDTSSIPLDEFVDCPTCHGKGSNHYVSITPAHSEKRRRHVSGYGQRDDGSMGIIGDWIEEDVWVGEKRVERDVTCPSCKGKGSFNKFSVAEEFNYRIANLNATVLQFKDKYPRAFTLIDEMNDKIYIWNKKLGVYKKEELGMFKL